MTQSEGRGSRPEEPVAPTQSRRPGGVLATVVIAVVVSGLVSAGVTLGVLSYLSRTNPQTVSLGSNVRITEESSAITVAGKAAPAIVSVVTDDTSSGPSFGSGFLITSDGYIVTNTRVLAAARAVTVLLAGDSKRYDARIVDSDCQSGVAVLKVDGVAQRPTLAFADAPNLVVGQTVIAMGTPLEPRAALSKGIVSALHAAVTVTDPINLNATTQFWDVTETDARLSPRSSGGPLLNVAGQVVGVNVSATSAGSPVAFALGAVDIQTEVEQIVRDGTLVVPSIGASVEAVGPGDAALRTLPEGGLVKSVTKGGPADLAGIHIGDVIIALDEVKIAATHPLGQLLRTSRYHPDQRVSLGVAASGQTTQVQLTLGREHPLCG